MHDGLDVGLSSVLLFAIRRPAGGLSVDCAVLKGSCRRVSAHELVVAAGSDEDGNEQRRRVRGGEEGRQTEQSKSTE